MQCDEAWVANDLHFDMVKHWKWRNQAVSNEVIATSNEAA